MCWELPQHYPFAGWDVRADCSVVSMKALVKTERDRSWTISRTFLVLMRFWMHTSLWFQRWTSCEQRNGGHHGSDLLGSSWCKDSQPIWCISFTICLWICFCSERPSDPFELVAIYVIGKLSSAENENAVCCKIQRHQSIIGEVRCVASWSSTRVVCGASGGLGKHRRIQIQLPVYENMRSCGSCFKTYCEIIMKMARERFVKWTSRLPETGTDRSTMR